jgi:Histidine kinase
MAAGVLRVPLDLNTPLAGVVDFVRWLRTHGSAVLMAGLLGVAYPLTSLVSSLGVLQDVTPAIERAAISRTVVMGLVDFPAFVLTGYVFARLRLSGWHAGVAALALGACAASVGAAIAYFYAWADMLVATAPGPGFALDSFANALSMALILFAHLQHSRVHEEAAKRLSAAKHAQREARRRLAQSHLQAVQARIDPQLLFDMLEAVRRAYESAPARAEQLLDELVAFLRAALPRLQHASSSVPREAELARALARLYELAGTSEVGMTLDVPAEVMNARFPPGVLLPMFNDALQARAGTCALIATRQAADCRLVLTLPARPSDATLERVRRLLADLYASSAALSVDSTGPAARVTVKVPYEHA